MRVLHFDCFSGLSGDMTLAALLDLGIDAEAVRRALASLDLPIKVDIQKIRKGGFGATQIYIDAPEQHEHRYLADVEAILARGQLSESQRTLAQRIFRKLAEAEAEVHNMPLERVHFHEVGALDSIADIVGVAVAFDLLGVERVTSRAVPTGNGMVKCAHGMMPIPAPATALLLRGAPLAATSIKGELTTPTGAAILTTIVNEWVDGPVMNLERIGCGAGQRELLEQPNLLRLLLGTSDAPVNPGERDTVCLLETNLDDVPGEIVGYCIDELFRAGALDVYTTALQMKKQRPGVLLSIIAPPALTDALEEIVFRETGTFGIRRTVAQRRKLQREAVQVQTPWGPVKAKRGWLASGFAVLTPEYEDCCRVARERGIPLREVYHVVRGAKVTT